MGTPSEPEEGGVTSFEMLWPPGSTLEAASHRLYVDISGSGEVDVVTIESFTDDDARDLTDAELFAWLAEHGEAAVEAAREVADDKAFAAHERRRDMTEQGL